MRQIALVALGLLSLAACGVDPNKVPSHAIYADDDADVSAGDSLSFALVGGTRSALPGTDTAPAASVIADIGEQSSVRGLQFVVLTGDYVRRSATPEWVVFGEQWQDVLKSDLVSNNKGRRKVEPMPGDQEYVGDKRLVGYGAAFDGVGVDIGLSRTASWYHFDANVDGETWRFVFVDTHKAALGSRWEEQVFWLPKVVSGDDFDHLLVFMPEPRITMSKGTPMDPGDGPTELLSIIDDNSGVMSLTAVFSGGAPANEAYLPSGNFGELYVVAGNGGIPGQTLDRWGPADDAGFKDLHLEAMFDLALMNEFDAAIGPKAISERLVDQAKARGEFEGFTGAYDGGVFPVQGWWVVTIEGKSMSATFRMRRHDASFRDVYRVTYTRKGGWAGEVLP